MPIRWLDWLGGNPKSIGSPIESLALFMLRDPVYVDDVVEAFLLAGAAESLGERLWNLGGPEPMPLARIAEIMSTAAGAPAPVFREFPEDVFNDDHGSVDNNSEVHGSQ